MSDLHEIDVVIKPNGELTVEIRGVKGAACLDITREMERLLGGRIIDRNHTYEYDEQPDAQTENDWLRNKE